MISNSNSVSFHVLLEKNVFPKTRDFQYFSCSPPRGDRGDLSLPALPACALRSLKQERVLVDVLGTGHLDESHTIETGHHGSIGTGHHYFICIGTSPRNSTATGPHNSTGAGSHNSIGTGLRSSIRTGHHSSIGTGYYYAIIESRVIHCLLFVLI